jgi:hypothetical protein
VIEKKGRGIIRPDFVLRDREESKDVILFTVEKISREEIKRKMKIEFCFLDKRKRGRDGLLFLTYTRRKRID